MTKRLSEGDKNCSNRSWKCVLWLRFNSVYSFNIKSLCLTTQFLSSKGFINGYRKKIVSRRKWRTSNVWWEKIRMVTMVSSLRNATIALKTQRLLRWYLVKALWKVLQLTNQRVKWTLNRAYSTIRRKPFHLPKINYFKKDEASSPLGKMTKQPKSQLHLDKVDRLRSRVIMAIKI